VCAKRERIRSREKAGGEDDGSAAIYILSSRRPGERLTDSDSIGTSLLVLSVWVPDSVSATPRCFSLLGSRFARPRPTDSDFLCKKINICKRIAFIYLFGICCQAFGNSAIPERGGGTRKVQTMVVKKRMLSSVVSPSFQNIRIELVSHSNIF
jgi:hypothetical protein